jgi:hypothetical protein
LWRTCSRIGAIANIVGAIAKIGQPLIRKNQNQESEEAAAAVDNFEIVSDRERGSPLLPAPPLKLVWPIDWTIRRIKIV